MERKLRWAVLIFSLLSCSISYSQNLTGIWRGYFITENDDQYKFELQLDQKGSRISGVSYSYLTTVFYGKALITGSFNKKEQSALVSEIKTVELRMAAFSSACIMKCSFQYAVSGKEQFLEGTFTSKFEKTTTGAKKGDDCGSGKVYLRKVPTSDFYIEPFLRSKLRADSIKSALPPTKKSITGTKPPINNPVRKTTPVVTDKATVKKNPPVVTQKPNKNNISKTTVKANPNNTISKITPPEKQIRDSVQKIEEPVTKEVIQKPSISVPEVLKNRENALVKTLVVNSPDVTIKLYDNGVVDGDTISVYLDKKLLLYNKGLSEVPITFHLKMDNDNVEHEVTMVAENLGRIPPNTSLMIVECGDQRFNVFISSNEQKNAVVRFRYQKAN
ncbi:MAG TPA: hypothetical protein VHD35_10740 [Chitinophagaceae bacterium]|nr:hypothetical protein [Chitinophagaceae bacterium]